MTEAETDVTINDVSPVFEVKSSLLTDKTAVGFTISYSNGTIMNIIGGGNEPEASLTKLMEKRKVYITLQKKQKIR